MHDDSEKLWLRIRPALEDFAERVAGINPSLIHSLASSTNDAFFLRAYLAFKKHNDGDDVAISADAIVVGGELTITTDISYGEGEILAVGPTSTFSLDDFKVGTATVFDEWLVEFESFLRAEEDNLLRVASELS